MIKRIICLSLLLLPFLVNGQNLSIYEKMVTEESLYQKVDFLANDQMEGRATGTTGNIVAERYLYNKFKSLGLKPYNWAYTQSASFQDSITVRNVVGLLPAIEPTEEYVIVSAHYDHLGVLAGKVYNGADDNASGVAVMLTLAELFVKMKADGTGPKRNIIFVAFDGKELDMTGSRHFVETLSIPKRNIICEINLDMLGTDLEPVHKRADYILFLGEENLPEKFRGIVSYLAGRRQYNLDLDQTFYGSKDFYRFYFGMSDQIIFDDAGIPAVTFSSGFHKHTYKPTDTIDIINFKVLKQRVLLIFNFIERVCKY